MVSRPTEDEEDAAYLILGNMWRRPTENDQKSSLTWRAVKSLLLLLVDPESKLMFFKATDGEFRSRTYSYRYEHFPRVSRITATGFIGGPDETSLI